MIKKLFVAIAITAILGAGVFGLVKSGYAQDAPEEPIIEFNEDALRIRQRDMDQLYQSEECPVDAVCTGDQLRNTWWYRWANLFGQDEEFDGQAQLQPKPRSGAPEETLGSARSSDTVGKSAGNAPSQSSNSRGNQSSSSVGSQGSSTGGKGK